MHLAQVLTALDASDQVDLAAEARQQRIEEELHAVLRCSMPRPGTASAPPAKDEPPSAGAGAGGAAAAESAPTGLLNGLSLRDSLGLGLRDSLGYVPPRAVQPPQASGGLKGSPGLLDDDADADADASDDDVLRRALEDLPSPPRPGAGATSTRAAPHDAPAPHSASGTVATAVVGGEVPRGRVLHCTVRGTWGDPHYYGLAALQLLDEEGLPLSLRLDHLSAAPADLNAMTSGGSDPRTVDKLLDASRVTTNSAHMWLAPWQPGNGRTHTLTVRLPGGEASVSALRVWNYNKSADDASRGIRWLRIELDGSLLSPAGGLELRKAPGHAEFDFGQTIPLTWRPQPSPRDNDATATETATPPDDDDPVAVAAAEAMAAWRAGRVRGIAVPQDYLAPVHPRGHVIRLRLLSSWGDPHYLGLDALQLFGPGGAPLPICCGAAAEVVAATAAACAVLRVHASPSDINVLPHVLVDPRTVDKLFVPAAAHASAPPPAARKASADVWLAPWQPEQVNELCFYSDTPISLAMVRALNYSKTAARGVRDFELLVDDLLVYQGQLRPADADVAVGTASASSAGPQWQSILFTDEPELLRREAVRVHHTRAGEEHVLLINSGQVVNQALPPSQRHASITAKAAAEARPSTAVPRSQ